MVRLVSTRSGRPQLRFGREGFPQVQILENRSASAKPLRETPSPCDHLHPEPEGRRPPRETGRSAAVRDRWHLWVMSRRI